MRIDVHVHVSAFTPGHGFMSRRLMDSFPFRFMRWHFGFKGEDATTERALEQTLFRTLDETPQLDAVALLAFDGVHDREGNFLRDQTHLYVTNDYVIQLARRHRKVLFGASIHPYRKDAVAELERCAKAGAVLVKWLPLTQGINPADEKCFPFYDALAHHGIPLLSHTGGEQCLPRVDETVASPALLEPALRRGVKVIAAHCGTRATRKDESHVPTFCRMAREHEHFYGDTSAFNLPMRWYGYGPVMSDPQVRAKLVHGSDWPVIVLPPPLRGGPWNALASMCDRNWLRRDVKIKQYLGFDDAYWERAGKVLRVNPAG